MSIFKPGGNLEYRCSTCGCVVSDKDKHIQFHEALVKLFEENYDWRRDFGAAVIDAFGKHEEWSRGFADAVRETFEAMDSNIQRIVELFSRPWRN